MKTAELQKKSNKELEKMLIETQEEMRKQRFGFTGAGDRKSHKIKENRKTIARILTVLNVKVK
jgi:large subunit ribosomal protein L29